MPKYKIAIDAVALSKMMNLLDYEKNLLDLQAKLELEEILRLVQKENKERGRLVSGVIQILSKYGVRPRDILYIITDISKL